MYYRPLKENNVNGLRLLPAKIPQSCGELWGIKEKS